MSLFLLSVFTVGVLATHESSYDCRPGQPCWPSRTQWQQFNATLGGRLFETIPIAAPCYKSSPQYNETACKVVQDYYGDSVERGEHFGQTYWLNWETCKNSGCALLESDPTQTTYGECSIGRLSTYYVDVEENEHISATLRFVKEHNIRLSIKNTGHDFFGRSSVPNSLALWTHNLQSLKFHSEFTASDCPAANGANVGELEAGVIAGDAYRYFNSYGMDITGGYEQSVGIVGGFAQGGGVGSFTTAYGLMADTAVEFEVVTADGEVRVINECNDPDLFWAMRGGGGGTFAILTKYRVKVFPSLPIHAFTFNGNFTNFADYKNATTNIALRDMIKTAAEHQTEWSAQLVTGQLEVFPNMFELSLVLPYNDDGSKLKAATASFREHLLQRTDLSISQDDYVSYANYATYLSVTAAAAKITEPSGISSLLATRLIPRHVFANSKSIDDLVEGMVQGIATARSLLNRTGTQIVLETPVSNPDHKQTSSANPAWRDALWHVIHVGEWLEPLADDVVQRNAKGFLGLLEPLKKLSPNGGAYFNEAHYLEPDWQQTYFGSFYNRLANIKKSYDPTHLFDCYKCVGWRGDQDPFYSCYA